MTEKKHRHNWKMFLPPRKKDPESFIICKTCQEIAYLDAKSTANFLKWTAEGTKGTEIRVGKKAEKKPKKATISTKN